MVDSHKVWSALGILLVLGLLVGGFFLLDNDGTKAGKAFASAQGNFDQTGSVLTIDYNRIYDKGYDRNYGKHLEQKGALAAWKKGFGDAYTLEATYFDARTYIHEPVSNNKGLAVYSTDLGKKTHYFTFFEGPELIVIPPHYYQVGDYNWLPHSLSTTVLGNGDLLVAYIWGDKSQIIKSKDMTAGKVHNFGAFQQPHFFGPLTNGPAQGGVGNNGWLWKGDDPGTKTYLVNPVQKVFFKEGCSGASICYSITLQHHITDVPFIEVSASSDGHVFNGKIEYQDGTNKTHQDWLSDYSSTLKSVTVSDGNDNQGQPKFKTEYVPGPSTFKIAPTQKSPNQLISSTDASCGGFLSEGKVLPDQSETPELVLVDSLCKSIEVAGKAVTSLECNKDFRYTKTMNVLNGFLGANSDFLCFPLGVDKDKTDDTSSGTHISRDSWVECDAFGDGRISGNKQRGVGVKSGILGPQIKDYIKDDLNPQFGSVKQSDQANFYLCGVHEGREKWFPCKGKDFEGNDINKGTKQVVSLNSTHNATFICTDNGWSEAAESKPYVVPKKGESCTVYRSKACEPGLTCDYTSKVCLGSVGYDCSDDKDCATDYKCDKGETGQCILKGGWFDGDSQIMYHSFDEARVGNCMDNDIYFSSGQSYLFTPRWLDEDEAKKIGSSCPDQMKKFTLGKEYNVVTTDAIVNKGFVFDGTEDVYLKAERDFGYNPEGQRGFPHGLTDMTVSFWYRADGSNDHALFSSANLKQDNEFLLFFKDGKLQVIIDGETQTVSERNIVDGKWHNIILIREGSKLTTYIDTKENKTENSYKKSGPFDVVLTLWGQEIDFFAKSQTPITFYDKTPQGKYNQSTGYNSKKFSIDPKQAFKGVLDELKVWNYPLKESQLFSPPSADPVVGDACTHDENLPVLGKDGNAYLCVSKKWVLPKGGTSKCDATDVCSQDQVGKTTCNGGTKIAECKVNADGCLKWVTKSECKSGETCGTPDKPLSVCSKAKTFADCQKELDKAGTTYTVESASKTAYGISQCLGLAAPASTDDKKKDSAP